MQLLKITNADGSMVSHVNPAQLLFLQVFSEPTKRPVPETRVDGVKGTERMQIACGEVVAPGGCFIVWKQDEMDDICVVFELLPAAGAEGHLTVEG